MRVFISWLIANLEIVGAIILLPFIWYFISNHTIDPAFQAKPMWIRLALASLIIAFMGSSPTEGTLGDVINLCMSIAGAGVIILMLSHGSIGQLVIGGIIGTVCGIATAVFTANNFYDLVSLRWLYSNSATAKFEASALYSFSRFCIAFHIGAYAYALTF